MDETLRQWGKNIAVFRNTLRPDGTPRAPGDNPMGQDDLGQLLDPPVSQATVSRWEAGRMEPRRHYKQQLASVFGVDVTSVFPLTRTSVA